MNPIDQREVLDDKQDELELPLYNAATPESRDTPLLAIARLLWPQAVLLRKAALIGLVFSALLTILIPNSYESTVQLMPPDAQGGSGMAMIAALMGKTGIGAAGSSLMSDVLGQKNTGELFVGILQSRTVKDRIIDRFDLRKVYWRKTYAVTREKLASHTSVDEDRKTGIIKVTVSDRNKQLAAAIANAYVEELDRLLAQVTTSSAHRERVFLEQRLAVVHSELQQAAKDLSEFSSKNATIDLKDQGKAMVESSAVLEGQLIAAQSELSGLQQIYASDNVRVRALQARISELQHQLEKLGGKGYTGGTTLDSNALYPSLRQLPILGVEYSELYRRTKIAETVYEILTQEYEMARVQEAKEIPSVKVLDAPEVPEKKSWPPRTLLTLLGSFLAFVFACCWIVVKELWSEVDPNEPHKAFVSQHIAPWLRRNLDYLRGHSPWKVHSESKQ